MRSISILIICIIALFTTISVTNASYSFIDLKNDISDELNSTVSTLKNYFKEIDIQLKKEKAVVEDAKAKAESLKAASSEKETNPVVLNQGLVAMPNCDTSSEELAWSGQKWICRKPSYGTDCYPSSGETRINNGDGTFKCVQSGSYVNEATGLGACDGTEKRTQVACMFTNNKNGKKYQVDSGCSNGVQRYRQPCGSNGINSACKCPGSSSYVYSNGQGYCQGLEEYPSLQGRNYNFSFCTDHFTKIRMIQDGQYVEILVEGQNPDSRTDPRCGYRDYSSGWLTSHGLNGSGSLRGAFKRVDRIYVGPSFTGIGNFKYTYSSSGSGCNSVSGSGSGTSTSSGISGGSRYAFDNRSLTACPAGSAQKPNIRLNFNAILGTRTVLTDVPTCSM
jgi:hypothetical protein